MTVSSCNYFCCCYVKFLQLTYWPNLIIVKHHKYIFFCLKLWSKHCVFTILSTKNTLKSLLVIHCLTVLAENLHKGTSQGCKIFDGSAFLNFRFLLFIGRQSFKNSKTCDFCMFWGYK